MATTLAKDTYLQPWDMELHTGITENAERNTFYALFAKQLSLSEVSMLPHP